MKGKTILIWGINGKMGKVLAEKALEAGCKVYGFDVTPHAAVKTFSAAADISLKPDVIIDFSRPAALPEILNFALSGKIPVVLATTGYSPEQSDAITEAAKSIPVFKSGNMSVGVNMLVKLVAEAAKTLSGYDIEIIEKHHNQKVDAPSGTALMLAAAANDGNKDYVYGRQGESLRKSGDITIHAVRGGSIIGEHDVIFAGGDEVVTLSHTALSKGIFAGGALRAAKLLLNKKPGLYDFGNI